MLGFFKTLFQKTAGRESMKTGEPPQFIGHIITYNHNTVGIFLGAKAPLGIASVRKEGSK